MTTKTLRTISVHAATTQAFWETPESFFDALRERLPGWSLVVAKTAAELGPAVRASEIVVGWPFPPILARGAASLRWAHFFTSGIPESWEAVAAKGAVRVTTQRGDNARAVAEHAMMLALAAIRGVRSSSLGAWDPEAFAVPRAADAMRACVIGYGAIGRTLARLAKPFFADVVVTSRTAPEAAEDGVRHTRDARSAAAKSDVVFVCVPLTAETRALFDIAFFEALKDGAIVVNVARGELVDEASLLAFLARSPRSFYAADVAHPEPYPEGGALLTHDRVLLTPHVGARREDAWKRITARTLWLLDAHLETSP